MPYSALKPCSYPGCPNLVRSGYCADHTHQVVQIVHSRDPKRQALYDRHWAKRRARQLAEFPWCVDCLNMGIYTPATDVHHKVRHEGNRAVFLSSPLESLCHSHHSQRTQAEVKQGRGAGNVSRWGALSARGLPHKKNFQCEESS